MRPDQPSAGQQHYHTIAAYSARWAEWKPLCIFALNGDRTRERIAGYEQRHSDRISLLHRTLGISMKIISRHSLDDPRITEPELQRRIRAYRVSKEKMNPWKNKGDMNGKSTSGN